MRNENGKSSNQADDREVVPGGRQHVLEAPRAATTMEKFGQVVGPMSKDWIVAFGPPIESDAAPALKSSWARLTRG